MWNSQCLTREEIDQDYYTILNCVRSSTITQITAEYRHLARRYHPDKQQQLLRQQQHEQQENQKQHEEPEFDSTTLREHRSVAPHPEQQTSHMWTLVQTAYETLSDPIERQSGTSWFVHLLRTIERAHP
eukprot:TRINITY_DN3971_c0_g1_i3.p2 TRINITY_DN3971_c0_g1~~TRINITY_DN3971_c0_g1_i3.p2  ORF type:complete len:129 (+),score=21.62 TRINITY_DN3971_c0_g1_i3:244-630(+)